MTEYRRNGYEDDDMRAVIDQIEGWEAEKASIMAAAMGECAALSRKIKDQKKQAKDELGIPLKVLNPLLKRRKLERKIADLADGVDEDYIEVFEDACGQFCLFAEVATDDGQDTEDEPEPEDANGHNAVHAAEQAEGDEVLNGTTH